MLIRMLSFKWSILQVNTGAYVVPNEVTTCVENVMMHGMVPFIIKILKIMKR
jgi:hypothetical protein